mmetsp:Transcript_2926/g.9123  ORF Transcript_2926/g.9123 Transcript_2926/m.9123 type:complete len:337 (-) Transcript_2926:16-1026(-)
MLSGRVGVRFHRGAHRFPVVVPCCRRPGRRRGRVAASLLHRARDVARVRVEPVEAPAREEGREGGVDRALLEAMLQRERVEHARHEALGRLVPLAQHEALHGRVARRLRLHDRHVAEEELQLRAEERRVRAAEDLGDERAAGRENERGDVLRGEEQLVLHVLVQLVEAGDVGGAVAHDKLGFAAEETNDLVRRRRGGDVTLEDANPRDRRHVLEIHRHDAALLLRKGRGGVGVVRGGGLGLGEVLGQARGEHLAPRPGRGAEVHRAGDAVEDVEALVDLQELVGAAGAVPLLLRLAVVHVALVLARAAHGDGKSSVSRVSVPSRSWAGGVHRALGQ